MPRHNAITKRVGEALAGQSELAKLKMLLRLDGGSIDGWAAKNACRGQEVHMTLSGARPYPAIREKMAATANVPVEEIDRIIEQSKAEKITAA